ncbi:hypothetical protein ACM66B_000223 [Microbotryomycetes sp. NB124-2]
MDALVPRVDAMSTTEVRGVNSSLMTEQFNWAPETFAKEGMDIANESLYTAAAQLEHSLRALAQPRTTGTTDTDNAPDITLSEDDVQKGVYRLETLLETSIDKHFDLFEIFVLRNTFNMPADLVPYIVLDHQRALDPALRGQDGQAIREYEYELAQYESELKHERELECVLKAWQQRVDSVENAARDDGFLSGSDLLSSSAQALAAQVLLLRRHVAALLDTPAPAVQASHSENAEPWATRSAFVNWAAQAKTSGLPKAEAETAATSSQKELDDAGEQAVATVLSIALLHSQELANTL